MASKEYYYEMKSISAIKILKTCLSKTVIGYFCIKVFFNLKKAGGHFDPPHMYSFSKIVFSVER